MALANVIAFPVYKILNNLALTQISLFKNNYWSKQKYESCSM